MNTTSAYSAFCHVRDRCTDLGHTFQVEMQRSILKITAISQDKKHTYSFDPDDTPSSWTFELAKFAREFDS